MEERKDINLNDHAEQHCPGPKLPFPAVLIVSLSPLSVCSCMRSSDPCQRTGLKQQDNGDELNLFSSPPTALPCTTFSRRILATSSACCMLLEASSVEARARFCSKLSRAARRAADRVGRSPRGAS
jgi:hypothetical protein